MRRHATRPRPRSGELSLVSIAVALVAGFALAVPALGQPRFAAGVRAGTAGVGVDLVGRAGELAHFRLAAGTVRFDGTISTSDLAYDAEAQVSTALLLLDWYPGGGAFRFSVGAGWNGTEIEVTAPLEQLLPLDPEDLALLPPLGDAVGTAEGDSLVPVVLLGWGNPFRGGRWNVAFEVGAFYQGEPEVGLGVRTNLPIDQIPGGTEALSILIEEEERELERELEDYTVIPVVSLSLTYSF